MCGFHNLYGSNDDVAHKFFNQTEVKIDLNFFWVYEN